MSLSTKKTRKSFALSLLSSKVELLKWAIVPCFTWILGATVVTRLLNPGQSSKVFQAKLVLSMFLKEICCLFIYKRSVFFALNVLSKGGKVKRSLEVVPYKKLKFQFFSVEKSIPWPLFPS